MNTVNSPVVKLRRYYIGEEKLGKKEYERCVDGLYEKLPKKLLDAIWWISKNKIEYDIKRINYIYDKIGDELLNYRDEDLFLAHKFENGKRNYNFKPLNELLWADNKFYYGKFKDSVWFLSCSTLKDKVVLLSKCVEDPEIKETEKEKLIKAEEPYLKGYAKWKEIVKKEYNKKVSIYEVKEPIEYILYLEFNDINKSVGVKEQHYIQQSESEIKCYVEIYDTGLVSSCLEDYIDKKICKCLSKIGTLNDNDRISEELQKLNLTVDEQDETESEEDYGEEGIDDIVDDLEDYTYNLDDETDEREPNDEKSVLDDYNLIGINESNESDSLDYNPEDSGDIDDDVPSSGLSTSNEESDNRSNTTNEESKKWNKGEKKRNSIIYEGSIQSPDFEQSEHMKPDQRKEEGREWERIAYNYLCENIPKIFQNRVVKRIRWINDSKDSKESYDIVVEFNNETKYYFEVKSSKEDKFMVSISQYNFMKKNRETYYIFKINTTTKKMQVINLHNALNETITIEHYIMKIQ